MFQKLTVIDRVKHREYRFSPVDELFFAKDLSVIPISYSEVEKISCDFPVVFVGEDKPILSTIVGLDGGKSRAIDDNGKWKGDYIPTFIRKYPFTFVKDSEDGNLKVGIDSLSGCFSNPEGENLFDSEGNTTALFDDIITLLKEYEEEIQTTNSISEMLLKKGLLKNSLLTIGEGEDAKKIGGFKIFDWQKSKDESDDTLANWWREGLGVVLSHHTSSLKNFSKMVSAI